MTRKIDNQPFADRVAYETGAGASRCNRNIRIGRGTNDGAGLLCVFRKRRADRLDLIDRRICRVKLPRQIIKPDVTTGLLDFPFLERGHPLGLDYRAKR